MNKIKNLFKIKKCFKHIIKEHDCQSEFISTGKAKIAGINEENRKSREINK